MIRFNPGAPQPASAPPDWPRQLAQLAGQAQHPALQAFYQAGCPAADCPLEDAPLIALDIETTGLNSRRDAIVSLGLAPFRLNRIRCSDALYQVVKPTSELSQHLGEGLQFPVIDTMELEARLHRGDGEPSWFQRLFGKRHQSIRLADSRLRYNLPLYQAHHALTDAIATAELLQAQALTHYSPQVPVSRLWS